MTQPNREDALGQDFEVTARIHAEGDRMCGRQWDCACAACRVVKRRALDLLRDLASAIRERDETQKRYEDQCAGMKSRLDEIITLRAREKALREALDVIAGHVPMVGSDAEADLACTVDMLRAYARDILDGKL